MEANSAKKMRRVEGNRTVQQMAGALYYAETFSKEFAVVSLPGAEQRSADIYAALTDHPRNAKARRVVSRIFFLAGARSVPSKRVRQTARRGIWRDAAPAAGRVGATNAPVISQPAFQGTANGSMGHVFATVITHCLEVSFPGCQRRSARPGVSQSTRHFVAPIDRIAARIQFRLLTLMR